MDPASKHFERGAAEKEGDPSGLAHAAAAIAAPTESRAPVLDMADAWLQQRSRPAAAAPADGVVRRAAATEGASSRASDAQGLLRKCRQSMAGGEQRRGK